MCIKLLKFVFFLMPIRIDFLPVKEMNKRNKHGLRLFIMLWFIPPHSGVKVVATNGGNSRLNIFRVH